MNYWDSDDDGSVCVPNLPTTKESFGPPLSIESQNQSFLSTSVYENSGRQKFHSNTYNDGRTGNRQDNDSWRRRPAFESEFESRNWRDGESRGSQTRGRGRERNNYSQPSEDKSNLSFVLQQCFVGRVIGSGGKTIKRIQEQSGARINISQKSTAEGDAEVTISGPPEAQALGKDLIDELINDTRRISLNDTSNNGRGRDDFEGRSNYGSENRWSRGGGQRSNTFQNSRSWNNDSSGSYKNNDDQYQNSSKSYTENDSGAPKIDWANVNQKHDEYLKEKWGSVPPIVKQLYVEDDEIKNMDETDVAEFRLCYNNIKVTDLGEDPDRRVPNPVLTFIQAFRPYAEILEEIRKQGFEKPSPIQCQAWPIIMQGIDCIGIAQTGTGKTLAFLLPALIHIDSQPKPRPGPTALILCPTRELAIQVFEEAKKYTYKGITCGCLYGGASRRDQAQLVKGGLDIIVGTPGRLCDLIESDILNVLYVTYVVMDEADRMLDLGFEPQIRKVLYMVRPDRQTTMTSATWPENVRDLAKTFSKGPIQIHIGSLDLQAVQSVEQIIEIIEEDEKKQKLFDFLYDLTEEDKVMVFADRKSTVDDVASDLALKEFHYSVLHSGVDQDDREQALEDFKSGVVNILVATDVASRGIDVKDVTYVFNFDFPVNIEEYVHRVGRTGRAGRTGKAITLMAWGDRRKAAALIKILEKANATVPAGLQRMAEKYEIQLANRPPNRGFRGGGRGRKSWNEF